MFIHSFRRRIPFFNVAEQEGAEQQDDDADANRRVADIKDIKGPERAKMQVEEVDHIAELDPIDDIAERAAEHQRQRQLVAALLLPCGSTRRRRRAIAAVTATSSQRCVSFCAWARPRLIP